jgi:hypothetical protein
MPVQELHHQTSEALECTWDAHSGADTDKDVACSLDVDLELARLIDGRIEEGEQALWRHVSYRKIAMQLPPHSHVPDV